MQKRTNIEVREVLQGIGTEWTRHLSSTERGKADGEVRTRLVDLQGADAELCLWGLNSVENACK